MITSMLSSQQVLNFCCKRAKTISCFILFCLSFSISYRFVSHAKFGVSRKAKLRITPFSCFKVKHFSLPFRIFLLQTKNLHTLPLSYEVCLLNTRKTQTQNTQRYVCRTAFLIKYVCRALYFKKLLLQHFLPIFHMIGSRRSAVFFLLTPSHYTS